MCDRGTGQCQCFRGYDSSDSTNRPGAHASASALRSLRLASSPPRAGPRGDCGFKMVTLPAPKAEVVVSDDLLALLTGEIV